MRTCDAVWLAGLLGPMVIAGRELEENSSSRRLRGGNTTNSERSTEAGSRVRGQPGAWDTGFKEEKTSDEY